MRRAAFTSSRGAASDERLKKENQRDLREREKTQEGRRVETTVGRKKSKLTNLQNYTTLFTGDIRT